MHARAYVGRREEKTGEEKEDKGRTQKKGGGCEACRQRKPLERTREILLHLLLCKRAVKEFDCRKMKMENARGKSGRCDECVTKVSIACKTEREEERGRRRRKFFSPLHMYTCVHEGARERGSWERDKGDEMVQKRGTREGAGGVQERRKREREEMARKRGVREERGRIVNGLQSGDAHVAIRELLSLDSLDVC